MTTYVKDLVVEDTDFPLLTKTIISQQFIEKNGNQVPFSKLIQLNTALDALQPIPPNASTVWFNDTLLLDNLTNSLTVNPTSLVFTTTTTPSSISNTGGFDMSISSSSQLILNSYDNVNINSGVGLLVTAGDYIQMTANNDFISFQADDDLSLVSSGLGNINLNAPNINSYNYAIPICFEKKDSGVINYGGGQTLTNVFQIDLNSLPINFFVDSPQTGYTSNIWRIVFTLQTWNAGGQNNNSDKALAYYIEFEDQSATTYKPFMINDITPYCKHNNNSTWSGGGSNSEFQSHSWNDYVDFTPLGGTGSGNFPLRFKIYMGCDNPKDFTFTFVLGLTRTNLI